MADEDAIRREIDAIRPEEDDALLRRAKELEEGSIRIDIGLPEPPTREEIAARLDPLRERLETSRREATAAKGEDMREAYRSTGVGLSIAYVVIGVPILGWLVGWGIDSLKPGGLDWGAVFGIGGAFLGVALAIHRLNRENQGR